jgi:hypothetical protein
VIDAIIMRMTKPRARSSEMARLMIASVRQTVRRLNVAASAMAAKAIPKNGNQQSKIARTLSAFATSEIENDKNGLMSELACCRKSSRVNCDRR